MKKLTTAQARLLFVLQMGGHVNQGNLVLIDGGGRCVSYDRRSLRELINRDLVWVNPETTHWEERPKENVIMKDEKSYHQAQAELLCGSLADMVKVYKATKWPERQNKAHVIAVRRAEQHVDTYLGGRLKIDEEEFRKWAPTVNANPDWYGQYITVENELRDGKVIRSRYRVAGLDTSRPKNTIMLVTSRGRECWASPAFVARNLGEAPPEVKTGKRNIQL